ncbi:MAG: DUF4388 domain-containing protein [Gemmatimonadota bacterium]
MGIEGELSSVTLADICQLLSMGRKTGCLTVTHRTNFGYVYFEAGRVIYATVLNRPDRLGELLVLNEVVSREDLDAAVRSQARHSGKRLGRILIEQGSLSEADLRRFITMQIEEAVYHLFAWEEGSFHFETDQKPDADSTLLVSIPVETLLLEGARRVDELSMIEKRIPSREVIFEVERLPKDGDEAELTEEQQKLLRVLNGNRTVTEVIEESGLVEFDALKGLFGLLQAGYVQASGEREGGAAAGTEDGLGPRLNLANAFYRAGMLEDAEREYRAALAADPEEPVACARLGVIALRSGRPQDALEHYEVLVAGDREKPRLGTHLNRALALELLGRYSEALEALERAARLRPGDGAVHLARGVVRFKDRDVRGAKRDFEEYRKGLGEATQPSPVYFAYAVLASAALGEVEEAVRIGRDGLNLYSGSTPILVNLGVVLERKGDANAAEALYLRAVSQNPPSPQAHRNLGDLAHARGDQAGARAHYERAVKLAPALGVDLYLKLGNLAYEEGDRTWARQHWEKALELNPENETIRTNLDLISSHTGP